MKKKAMNQIIAIKVKFDKIDIEKDMAPHQSAHPATRRQKIIPIKSILFSYLKDTTIAVRCQFNDETILLILSSY